MELGHWGQDDYLFVVLKRIRRRLQRVKVVVGDVVGREVFRGPSVFARDLGLVRVGRLLAVCRYHRVLAAWASALHEEVEKQHQHDGDDQLERVRPSQQPLQGPLVLRQGHRCRGWCVCLDGKGWLTKKGQERAQDQAQTQTEVQAWPHTDQTFVSETGTLADNNIDRHM